MKFKVIAGGIQDGGVQYSAGKIFDSAKPLHQIFPNKVELIGPESKAVTNVEDTKTNESPAFDELENVSGLFDYSPQETGLVVGQREKEFWVFDKDDLTVLPMPLNSSALRKNQVKKFIRENCEGDME